MNKLIELLWKLKSGKFYGEITIKMESGIVVHVTKKETLNAKEYRD